MVRRRTAVLGAILTLGVCAAASARAQMPESYRQVQLSALETDRRLALAMADSMQERYYHEKVTPPQRDFAMQLVHAAGAVPMIASMTLGGPRPTMPDSSTAYTRAGLRAYINAAYDYGANLLRTQTAADRETTVRFFGGATIPKWQVWDEIHQHTMWTLGQVVANFRAHGNPPPAFMFF
jgi:hypothetical protein